MPGAEVKQRKIIPEVVEQHAEEAAFLWLLRDDAVDAPHYDREDLGHLEERVEAHLDGLRVAGPAGFELAKLNFESRMENGEAFAATVLALESRDKAILYPILDAAAENPDTRRGAISAMGWCAPSILNGIVQPLLNAKEPLRRFMGLAACSVHRVDPQGQLANFFNDPAPFVRARAYRLAGELGRADLISLVDERAAREEDGDARFWLHWASVLLGDRRDHLTALTGYAEGTGRHRWRAVRLLIPAMDHSTAKNWIGRCVDKKMQITAAGLLGDPQVIPWLIEQMKVDETARLAGEAFSLITEIDLAYDDLERDGPEGFDEGPTEDPKDENVAMDENEDLPWPDPALVARRWQKNGYRFPTGQRYLLGRPLDENACRRVFRKGFQRQQRAAAMAFATLRPEQRLENWRVRT